MSLDSRKALVDSISPNQIESYLHLSGWVQEGRLSDIATIWHRPEPEFREYELLQPLQASVKDYVQRVRGILETLSEFEARNVLDVMNDLATYQADIVSIRVAHQDVEEGSIPLNDGVLLIEKAKELLVSVAKSTFHKKRYFTGGKLSDDISRLVDSMRLGQTEYGSYVINLIAPIERSNSPQTDDLSVSLTRAVSSTLARSLSAITSSIEEYKNTGNPASFDSTIEKGVSANLCDALIGLSGELHSRDVNISISLSRTEDLQEDLNLLHSFSANTVTYLQEASEYLKDNYVLENQTITGQVVKLSHEDEQEAGLISVSALVGEAYKNVSIDLTIDDYWEAHAAHKNSEIVECTGDLHVSPRKASLLNPSNFRVIRTLDAFE